MKNCLLVFALMMTFTAEANDKLFDALNVKEVWLSGTPTSDNFSVEKSVGGIAVMHSKTSVAGTSVELYTTQIKKTLDGLALYNALNIEAIPGAEGIDLVGTKTIGDLTCSLFKNTQSGQINERANCEWIQTPEEIRQEQEMKSAVEEAQKKLGLTPKPN